MARPPATCRRADRAGLDCAATELYRDGHYHGEAEGLTWRPASGATCWLAGSTVPHQHRGRHARGRLGRLEAADRTAGLSRSWWAMICSSPTPAEAGLRGFYRGRSFAVLASAPPLTLDKQAMLLLTDPPLGRRLGCLLPAISRHARGGASYVSASSGLVAPPAATLRTWV